MVTPLLIRLQNRPRFTNQRSSARGMGPLIPRMPLPRLAALFISGVTRNNTGAAVGDCSVYLYRTSGLAEELWLTKPENLVQTVISDGSGNFTFRPVNNGNGPYKIVSYKAGVPDLAGTTVNTIVGN